MLAEPRIWPASRKVAFTPAVTSKTLGVSSRPPEIVEAIQCVEGRIERVLRVVVRTSVTASAPAVTRVFLQQIGRIQHDQSRQFARGRRRNDFSPKPPLGQQRQTPAMIQMRMGQQHVIDAGGVKAERFGVFLVQLAATLV